MNKRDYILINAVANGCAIIFEGEGDEKPTETNEESTGGVEPSLDFDASEDTETPEPPETPAEDGDQQNTESGEDSQTEKEPAEEQPEQQESEPAQIADEVNPGDPEEVNTDDVRPASRMTGPEIANWYVDNGYFLKLMRFLHEEKHIMKNTPGMKVDPVRYKPYLNGSLVQLFNAGKINSDANELALAELIIEHSIPAMFNMISKGELPHIPTKEQPQQQQKPQQQPKGQQQQAEQPQQEEVPEPEAPAEEAPEQPQEAKQ